MKKLFALAAVVALSNVNAHSINGDHQYGSAVDNRFIQDGRAQANGNGRAKGGFNFGMNFSGDADMDQKWDGLVNNAFDGVNAFNGRNRYYDFPVYK